VRTIVIPEEPPEENRGGNGSGKVKDLIRGAIAVARALHNFLGTFFSVLCKTTP